MLSAEMILRNRRLFCALGFVLSLGACGASRQSSPGGSFLTRSGQSLVDERGRPVVLRGIGFGNDVWSSRELPPATHHSEVDFARIAGWGMNAVRFYLNYQLFEDDRAPYQYKDTGFAWIDQNVAWAKANGVYLLLNIHIPPGGFQSNGQGNALWTEPENQQRLIALWAAIAERYRGEATIAGYDLLNEPRPTTSRQQWVDLAGRLVSAIRQVDPKHLLFIERTLSVGNDWDNDAEMNFFTVNDENVVYQFHFYEPFEYTHQHASWLNMGDGGKFPDEERISSTGLTWYNWSHQPKTPPQVPPGDSDWTYFESEPYALDDPKINALGVSLVSELNAGSVYFDDIVVKEVDADGKLVRTVYQDDLESLAGWYFWQAGTQGSGVLSPDAHAGNGALLISGSDHDANFGSAFRFIPTKGMRYAVGGYMKGTAVANESRPDPRGNWTQVSRGLIRLDYYTAESEPYRRDKKMLEGSLARFLAWGKAKNVPLYLGEFGLMHQCFEGGRGGEVWVADMLDIAAANSLNFTYHTYHETNFGLFLSEPSRLPDEAEINKPLLSAFEKALERRSSP